VEQGRGKLMTRRTLRMLAMIVAAVLVACVVALLTISEKAEASFPGKYGKMAYARASDGAIRYSLLEPGGGAKTEVAGGHKPSFSPDGGASAREASSGASQGFKPGGGAGPAYRASEKLQMTKTKAGARVTLNWVYAEEGYVSVGYQVENLDDKRRVAGHPAELQPILGFGYGEPTPREEEYLKKYGLGDDVVSLTDEKGTEFRMADNSFESSAGPKPVEGPLENLVAFRPKKALKPGKDYDFRLQIPLYESAVVPLGEKWPPPEPFPGNPFVFNFDVPVHAVRVVDLNKKATAEGVTLRLDRLIDSPGRPRAVVCYRPPDDEHVWFINGGAGTLLGGWSTSGWVSTGSAWGNPPKRCHKLMLRAPAEGRTSFEVRSLQGEPDCPYDEDFEACYEKIGYRAIRGPWKFEFRVPKGAGGDRPAREANY
jgi:hypothetical protein